MAEDRSRLTRVLYFITYPHRVAGATRGILELAKNLPAGIDPVVVVSAEGPVAERFREAGVETHILGPGGELARFGRRFQPFSHLEKIVVGLRDLLPFTLEAYRLIRRLDPDLVHLNDPRGVMQFGPAARLARRPIVSSLRGQFSHDSLIRKLFEHLSDRIVTNAEAPASTLSAKGQRKALTVYDGIEDVRPASRSLPWLEDLRKRDVAVVCCFASVVPFKGHHHLIEAVTLLKERGLEDAAGFLMVGDMVEGYAFYHRWLRRLIRERELTNLTFTGWQDNPFAFYGTADICVLPSVSRERLEVDGQVVDVRGNEGFPQTHLEAMFLGLPVVGTRISGVPEQVEHGRTGLLVEPGDDEGLADALESLIIDADLRRSMGAAGRDRALSRFSTRAYVQGMVGVYDSLMDETGRRA